MKCLMYNECSENNTITLRIILQDVKGFNNKELREIYARK